MALTWFDLTVGVILIISGLLAMARGFTREVTSLLSWGVAGAAALYALTRPDFVAKVQEYFPQELIAKAALGAGVFLVVLIIMSLISIRFTDWLLDSAPGPFDRTLGLFYGLARGLALVVIAYLFYIWFIPLDKRLDAVRAAQSRPYIEMAAIEFTRFIPDPTGENLRNATFLYARRQAAPGNTAAPGNAPSAPSYNKSDQRQIDQIIQGTQRNKTNRLAPPPGASNNGQN